MNGGDRDGLADAIARCNEAIQAAEIEGWNDKKSKPLEVRCKSNLLLQNFEAAQTDFQQAVEFE